MEALDFVCHGTQCNPLIRIGFVLICGFFAALFTQSALDKVFDWEGNLGWLKPHFENTFLAPLTVPLVGLITLQEITTGVLNGIGAVWLLATGSAGLATVGLLLAAVTLLQLFTGQRIAKDYTGAHQVLGYFTLAMIGLLFAAA